MAVIVQNLNGSSENVMKMHTHNAFAVKKKLSADYRRDENCKVVNPNTGKSVTLPVVIIKMLRSGKVSFK